MRPREEEETFEVAMEALLVVNPPEEVVPTPEFDVLVPTVLEERVDWFELVPRPALFGLPSSLSFFEDSEGEADSGALQSVTTKFPKLGKSPNRKFSIHSPLTPELLLYVELLEEVPDGPSGGTGGLLMVVRAQTSPSKMTSQNMPGALRRFLRSFSILSRSFFSLFSFSLADATAAAAALELELELEFECETGGLGVDVPPIGVFSPLSAVLVLGRLLVLKLVKLAVAAPPFVLALLGDIPEIPVILDIPVPEEAVVVDVAEVMFVMVVLMLGVCDFVRPSGIPTSAPLTVDPLVPEEVVRSIGGLPPFPFPAPLVP